MGIITSKIVFQPPRRDRYSLAAGSDYFTIRTSLGEDIAAFYIEGPPGSKATILFSHGNSEDISQVLHRYMAQLAAYLRVNVMAYDYTGYGQSTGRPSEQAVYADVRAAWDYLIKEKGARPESIILYGRSLGSGPTVNLLTQKDIPTVGGVVLQSPFLSCVRVALNRARVPQEEVPGYRPRDRHSTPALAHSASTSALKDRSDSAPPRTSSGTDLEAISRPGAAASSYYRLPGDMFENVVKVGGIGASVPVLVIHGTVDRIVPYRHSKLLVEECERFGVNVHFLTLENAGHNDIRAKYQTQVFRRVNSVVLQRVLARLDNPTLEQPIPPKELRYTVLCGGEEEEEDYESEEEEEDMPSLVDLES